MGVFKQYTPDGSPEEATKGNRVENDNFISAGSLVRTDKDLVIKDYYNFNETESTNSKGRKLGLTLVRGGMASIYALQLSDLLVGVQDVTISRTVKLPAASVAGIGKLYFVKDISGSALATSISIVPTGTDTINGDTSTSIADNYGFMGFFTDGNNWFLQ